MVFPSSTTKKLDKAAAVAEEELRVKTGEEGGGKVETLKQRLPMISAGGGGGERRPKESGNGKTKRWKSREMIAKKKVLLCALLLNSNPFPGKIEVCRKKEAPLLRSFLH